MTRVDFDSSPHVWLDRLVCGELDEPLRRELLDWLERNPSHWRTCALAFLEAQVWQEALLASSFSEQVCRAHGESRCAPEPVAPPSPRTAASASRFRRWITSGLLAAALLLAFALGTALAPRRVPLERPDIAEEPPRRTHDAPVLATVNVTSHNGPSVPAQLQIPVVPVARLEQSEPDSRLSDYERQQWARRGFSIERERRFLPAKLPDGTRVMVPVERVKASYVGSKVS